MTTVAVLAQPPRSNNALSDLVEGGPLTSVEAAGLYEAMLRDVCVAVEQSGGDLLVNYRTNDEIEDEDAAAEEVRSSLADVLADPDAARYEVQVGSSFAARVGNTVTHLLEREGVNTAAAIEPAAALIERRHVDSAAMKLRQSDVVLGPSPNGRVYYAAFRSPIDFTDAFTPPPIETLTRRAADADLSIDFLEPLPMLDRKHDLTTVVPLLRARELAGRGVPQYTSEVLDELELSVEAGDEGLKVTRG